MKRHLHLIGIVMLLFFSATLIWAQAPKKKEVLKNDGSLASSTSGQKFFKIGKPQIGLDYGPLIPLGEVATVLGTSFLSFRLSGDIRAYQRWGIDFRGGLATGFYSMASKVSEITATVNIIPVLLYSKTSYLLNIKPIAKFGKLNPFAILGFGGGLVTLSETINIDVIGTGLEDSSKSNFEAMVNLAIGSSFLPKALPMMEFGLAIHYYMIFEQRNTNYLNISLGAIYRI